MFRECETEIKLNYDICDRSFCLYLTFFYIFYITRSDTENETLTPNISEKQWRQQRQNLLLNLDSEDEDHHS